MASSVTVTEESDGKGIARVEFAWTSHTDGVVTGVATDKQYTGKVIALITDPAAAGAAPTDDYDITVTDADGYDVLAGAGANRDTANTETVLSASLGVVFRSTLTFAASGAGSSKQGVAVLFIQ